MLVTVVHKDYNVFVVGEVQMSWGPFIYRVSNQFGLNFDSIFLIFLMTYQKKTRFAIKTKIKKLS